MGVKIIALLRSKILSTTSIFVSLLILIFLTSYRNIFNWKMVAIGDLSPWFLTAEEAFERFFYAWSNVGLGGKSNMLPSMFMIQYPLIVLIGPEFAQRSLFLLLMPLSCVTMYIFLKVHITQSKVVLLTVPFIYGINSVTIPQFMDGGFPLLFITALFPIFMLYLLSTVKLNPPLGYNVIMLSLVFGFMSSFHFLAPLMLLPFVIFVALPEILTRGNKMKTMKLLGALGAFVALSIPLATLAYGDILINLIAFYSTPVAFGYGQQRSTDILSTLLVSNYRHIFATENLLRITSILAFYALFSLFVKKQKKYYMSMLLLAASILLFWQSNAREWTVGLANSFPILFGYKDAIILVYMLQWILSILATLTLNDLSCRRNLVRNKISTTGRKLSLLYSRFARYYLPLLVIILMLSNMVLVIYFGPRLSDPQKNAITFFTSEADPAENWYLSGELVPQFFEEVNQWVEERENSEGPFRTAWIPSDYKTQYSILPFYNPETFMLSPEPDLVPQLVEPLVSGWTENSLLGYANIKYVIVPIGYEETLFPLGYHSFYEIDPQLMYHPIRAQFIWRGRPSDYLEIFNQKEDLKLVYNGTDFVIFENSRYIPLVSVYSRIFTVAPLTVLESRSPYIVPLGNNLLANPSFEQGLDAWMSTVEVEIDEDAIHGNYSLKTENYQTTYGGLAQSFPIENGTQYVFSFWAKAKNTEKFTVKSTFMVWNSTYKKVVGRSNQKFRVNEEWSYFFSSFITPEVVDRDLVIWFELQNLGSEDGGTPAILSFDDMMLVKGYSSVPAPVDDPRYVGFPTARARGPMLEGVPKLLSKVPNFSQNKSLFIFGDLTPEDVFEKYADLSDALIFLGNVNQSKLSGSATERSIQNSKVLVNIYEAESHVRAKFEPAGGTWAIISDEAAFSYGKAIRGSGILETDFYAPKDGYLQILIGGLLGDNVTLLLNNNPLIWRPIHNDTDLAWYETSPFKLEIGDNTLTLTAENEEITVDQILMVSSTSPELSLSDIFAAGKVTWEVDRLNPSNYRAQIVSDGPYFIVLGQSYHPAWQAKVAGKELLHMATFPYGWANGFYSSEGGSSEVTISFVEQNLRDLLVFIWAFTWVSLAIAAVFLRVRLAYKTSANR